MKIHSEYFKQAAGHRLHLNELQNKSRGNKFCVNFSFCRLLQIVKTFKTKYTNNREPANRVSYTQL